MSSFDVNGDLNIDKNVAIGFLGDHAYFSWEWCVFAFYKTSTSMKQQVFNFLSNSLYNETNIFLDYFK